MKHLSLRVLLPFFFLLSTYTLFAQTGDISGTVSDQLGAVVRGAEIRVVNQGTMVERHVTTNAQGVFNAPFVNPGVYEVFVESPGFTSEAIRDIRIDVDTKIHLPIRLQVGRQDQTVQVDGGGLALNTTDGSVSTVIDRKFVENIPLNGRSFQDLISMTPGVVTQTPQNNDQSIGSDGDFSVNGQRTESNYYTVDGVSGNTNPGLGQGRSQPATGGTVGSSTALGTTQSLVSVDALQEFRVESSTYSAEYGRSPGGQFSVVTRSGSDTFHGSAFDYLRNNFFDANDWFNDHYGEPAAALRQNDFGGTLGGPVRIPKIYDGKDRTFFFVSYEGLRLTLPTAAAIHYVPDTYMRQQAVPAMQGILNAFPIPNRVDYGTVEAPNFAQFISSYSAPSKIDSTSIRVDHTFSPKLALFFRYGDTPSSSSSRPSSMLQVASSNIQTYTLGATSQLSSKLNNELRLGYVQSSSSSDSHLDAFGGATPIDLVQALGMTSFSRPWPFIYIYFTGVGTATMSGAQSEESLLRQWNLVDTFSASFGHHQLRAGVDFRHLRSPLRPPDVVAQAEFANVNSTLSGRPTTPRAINYRASTPLFNETALFIQDDWRIHPRLALSLGLRWEVNPPPTEEHGDDAYTLLGSINTPTSLTLAPQGTPLYKTGWFNFAPRLGVAWTAHDERGKETIVRMGGGVFFDTANEVAGGGYTAFGFNTSTLISGAEIPFTTSQLTVPFSTQPPYTSGTIYAFPSHLQLPYTLEWNTSLQQGLGKEQTFTISYVGANGRRLLETQELSLTNVNQQFGSVYYFPTGVTSNYQALQLQYQRSVSQGVHALASYTWSHSIDFGSTATALPIARGNSDFDVRSNFQAGLSWDLPAFQENTALKFPFRDWGLDARVNARSAFPVTLEGNSLTDPATGEIYSSGVNYDPSQPLYLYGSQYPGARALNGGANNTATPAFTLPSGSSLGDAPRNIVRGFGATQFNLAMRRQFHLSEQVALQIRAEAFNVLNHPNFGYVDPMLTDLTFGQATQMLNASLGTMVSQYQQGGARSMQFALKIVF